jgi:sugar phosphate isomerase/epimerase
MDAVTFVAPELAATIEPLGAAPRRTIDRLRELPIRFVQLSAAHEGTRPRDLDRSARRDLRAVLSRREMGLAGVDLWTPPHDYVDPARTDEAVDRALQAIELAADLGRVPLCVVLPAPAAEGMPHESVETIARSAERFGVALADHAVPATRRNGIGVGVDPAAWLARDEDPADVLMRETGRLVSVRLTDLLETGMRGPIGSRGSGGRLDVSAFRSAVVASGFDRPVVADLRSWPDPWKGLMQTLHVWRGGE